MAKPKIKPQIKFTVKSFSGESHYNLEPLTRKELLMVFHGCVEKVIAVIPELDNLDYSVAAVKLASMFSGEDIYSALCAMLRDAMIRNEEGTFEIDDLTESDYFDDRPEEMYLAFLFGLKENFPKVFFTITQKLGIEGDPLMDLLRENPPTS
jgi:hypothetical protein